MIQLYIYFYFYNVIVLLVIAFASLSLIKGFICNWSDKNYLSNLLSNVLLINVIDKTITGKKLFQICSALC